MVAVDSLATLQIDCLNVLLEFLTSTKEELKSIVTQLEEELQYKTLECKMLASCSTSPRDFRPMDRSRKLSVLERETKASEFQRNLNREAKRARMVSPSFLLLTKPSRRVMSPAMFHCIQSTLFRRMNGLQILMIPITEVISMM